jgi:hypothetical protein
VSTRTVHPHAEAVIGAETERINGGQITLDALGIPYGTADVEIGLTEAIDLSTIDPRDDVRVVVRGSNTEPASYRDFDLGLRSVDVDHAAEVIRLNLATDEAILQDYATLTADNGARAHEASLRGVVDYVLGKIGASLEPGGPDANVSAYWELTNAVRNPICDTTSGFALSTNATGLTIETTPAAPVIGTAYLFYRALAAGTALLRVVGDLSVSPGDVVTGSAYLASPHGITAAHVYVQFLDNEGNTLSRVHGANVTTSSTVWARAFSTATAPPTASRAQLVLSFNGAASNALRFDAPMLTQGAELVTPFSGSTADSSTYTYEWDGDANNSASTRTPVNERLPETFIWEPGQTAWDFLASFTVSAGLRLFCDETRSWWLVDPATYAVPGFIVMQAFLTGGVDTISRDDAEVFATGVVVRYRWTVDGQSRVAYDTAGTPEKVVTIDYERPFPGPGAAAAILARRDGTGRVQNVTGLTQWAATPNMQASVTLPDTPEQQGKLISVTFSLGDDSLMDVGTSGLTDVIPGSWLATDPGEAWTSPPTPLAWEDWT